VINLPIMTCLDNHKAVKEITPLLLYDDLFLGKSVFTLQTFFTCKPSSPSSLSFVLAPSRIINAHFSTQTHIGKQPFEQTHIGKQPFELALKKLGLNLIPSWRFSR